MKLMLTFAFEIKHLIYIVMNKNEILKIAIKVLIYALTLIGGYLGVSALTSCTASHGVVSSGRATIITVDTTVIKHSGFVKSKNYVPYE